MLTTRPYPDIRVAATQMNNDLKCFANWALTSRLTVNVDKTKYMVLYGTKKMPRDIDSQVEIVYNEKILHRVKKYVYLGLIIDEKTSFECHINQLISNSYNKIYMLGKLRKYFDPRTAIQIFKSYILARLEYCDYLLIGSKKVVLEKLLKTVNHILRICFKIMHQVVRPTSNSMPQQNSYHSDTVGT